MAKTKSDLIGVVVARAKLPRGRAELLVSCVFDCVAEALQRGERVEVRGFGSFSLHYRPPRMGRNPKTGDAVALPGKHVPHFKPGKELKELINREGDENGGNAASTAPESAAS